MFATLCAALAVVPAEFGLPPQPCARRDGQRAGLHVADDDARMLQVDQRRLLDVAFELACDRHPVGAHAAGELRARVDDEVTLDVDIALELAGDADAAAAFD